MQEDITIRGPRPHSKSKLGCKRCKERRVKCDEKHPACGNCSRRYGGMKPCVWDYPPGIWRKSKVPTNDRICMSASSKAASAFPREMRTIEMRLFHHYITIFAPQQPRWGRYGSIEVDQFYLRDIPQLGFGHQAVLSGLLGLSACHYLSLAPRDQVIKRATRELLSQTIRYQVQLVSRIDKDTAQPALLVSMLLFGIMKFRAAFVEDNEPYKPPIEIFHMMRGVEALYQRSKSLFSGNNHIVQVMQLRPPDISELSEETLPVTILQDLLALRRSPISSYRADARKTCQGAIDNLHALVVALLSGEDSDWTRRRLYLMLGEAPQGFVDLLEDEDPLTMAIFARFMALMKSCDGSRYHQGVAEYEVHGIASLMPTEWEWSMKLPFRLLELDSLPNLSELNDLVG